MSAEDVVTVRLQFRAHWVPLITPPGSTQLEELPKSAKPLSIPLFPLPLASVKVVMEEFAPPDSP